MRLKKPPLLFSVIVASVFLFTENAYSLSMTQNIEKAEAAFNSGDYATARAKLETLLKSQQSMTRDEKVKTLILRMRVQYAFTGEVGLESWIQKIVEADPTAELDPVRDPPSARRLLKEYKEKMGVQSTAPSELSFEDQMRQESSFWVKLVPFGIGHFDAGELAGGLLFGGSEVAVLALASLIDDDEAIAERRQYLRISTVRKGNNFHPGFVAVFGMAGLWGYEVSDLLPEMYLLKPRATEIIRYGLSFFPFGVAQFKNGEHGKALAFGLSQSALLGLSVYGGGEKFRTLTATLFILSMLYGAYDGWVHAEDSSEPIRQGTPVTTLLPYTEGQNLGIEASLRF